MHTHDSVHQQRDQCEVHLDTLNIFITSKWKPQVLYIMVYVFLGEVRHTTEISITNIELGSLVFLST